MINKDAKLVKNIFEKDSLEQEPTRDGFGRGLVEAGEKDKKVVALFPDLSQSTTI